MTQSGLADLASTDKSTDMDQSLVTVGITCFNASATIERCIRSVQSQTWPNLEILIVDDGSVDSSTELVKKMAKRDERIRLVCHEKNQGTGVTRSRVMKEARGEFLCFLDDDDEAMPNRVEAQVEAVKGYEAEHQTNLVACYVSRLVVKPDGSETYVRSIGTHGGRPSGEQVALHLLCGESEPGFSYGQTGSGTLLARRSVFLAVGDFDSNFRRSQDLDWAVRLALLGGHFIGCRDALIRQHITHTEDKADKKPLIYALKLRRKYKDFLSERGRYLVGIVSAYVRFYYARGYRIRYRVSLLILALLSPRTVWKQWKSASKNRKKTSVI